MRRHAAGARPRASPPWSRATPTSAPGPKREGLRVENPGADLADRLGPLDFDWLFSIANLAIVPDAVLAKATSGAINFHDGPLPRYAGLNAPVWALLNRETRHGVTWHLIEGGIDEGDIVEQRRFDLDAGETALTLNTKCYAAAIESFGALVAALETGGPAPRPAGPRPAHLLRPRRPAGRRRPARLPPGAGGAGRPGPRPRLRPLLEPPRPPEDRGRRPAAAGRGSHGRLQSGAKRRPAPCSRWPTTAWWSPPAPAPSPSAGSPTWPAIRCPPAAIPLVGDGPAVARRRGRGGADRGDGRPRARRGALAPPPRGPRSGQAAAGRRRRPARRPRPHPARRCPPASPATACSPASRAWVAAHRRRGSRSTSPTPTPPSPPPLPATPPAGCRSASTPSGETFGAAARTFAAELDLARRQGSLRPRPRRPRPGDRRRRPPPTSRSRSRRDAGRRRLRHRRARRRRRRHPDLRRRPAPDGAAGRWPPRSASLLPAVADGAADAPPVDRLPMMAAAERARLLEAWNDTASRLRRPLHAHADRGPGRPHPRRHRRRLRGRDAHLRRARRPRQPRRAGAADDGRRPGHARRPAHAALARADRRRAGDPEGRRRLRPARPRLSGRAHRPLPRRQRRARWC